MKAQQLDTESTLLNVDTHMHKAEWVDSPHFVVEFEPDVILSYTMYNNSNAI